MSTAKSIHFVLVHGSCHGGWCWYKVANLLLSAGHTVTAVDLGASGINPKQLPDIPTYSGYQQPLTDVFESLPSNEKVVLVGHSMGGVNTCVAMEKFPTKIAVAIFCAAIMPTPDNFDLLQLNQQDSKFIFDSSGTATAIYFGKNFLQTMMYQLSPPEPSPEASVITFISARVSDLILAPRVPPSRDLTLCLSLARYYPLYRDEISRLETTLTSANYGSVNRAYIISEDDLVLPVETVQQYIKTFPPKEVETISGSDHMVMFSKPQELATCLQKIATKYV
ncbi:hypothetical protein LguiB_002288 [Lonicera macranthoides]